MKKVLFTLCLLVIVQNAFAGDSYKTGYFNHTQNVNGACAFGPRYVPAYIGDSISLYVYLNCGLISCTVWSFSQSTTPDYQGIWDTIPGTNLVNPLSFVVTQYGKYMTMTNAGNLFIIVPAAPPAIPVISGKKHGVCNRTNVNYTVPYQQGVNYFTWTVPPAATIVSGQGGTLLKVNFPNTTISGQITVTATNSFGTSSAGVITVNSLPAGPGPISGFPSVCSGSSGHVFQIAPVFSALSYRWVGPAGSHISDGIITSTNNILTTTSTSVTVNFGTVTPTSVLKVRVNNNCGSSAYRKLTLIPCGPRSESPVAETESLHNINSVNIFPTSVTSSITIQFNSIKTNDVEITFFDMNGRQLKTDFYKNIVGEFIKNENTEALSNGIYFLRIKAGDETVQKKFIKM